jgi:hypothetical protein
VAIRRNLRKKENNKKMRTNMIVVEEMKLDQTSTKNEPPQVGKAETLNLKNYLQLKLQIIHNLEEFATNDDQKCFRDLDVRMIIQEIDLLTRLLKKL